MVTITFQQLDTRQQHLVMLGHPDTARARCEETMRIGRKQELFGYTQ